MYEIKITFHVHLPEGVEKIGQPVVLGNRKELGSLETPIVKLRQQNLTYWKSDPISILFHDTDTHIELIKYKYAIHIVPKLYL
uniref:Uncharacterized protein n=1 Tax=Rhizophagus irregularis (strain DAOM 181602 / DAOM 197198 / MUCL 43194) TaxID=747089 RepID=U9TLY6_RHIID